jgi:hypothetical protein
MGLRCAEMVGVDPDRLPSRASIAALLREREAGRSATAATMGQPRVAAKKIDPFDGASLHPGEPLGEGVGTLARVTYP